MTPSKFAVPLTMLIIAAGAMDMAGGAAHAREVCQDMPSDAVVSLPETLRQWAQITCTSHGQTFGSRDGWIWASLKDASRVSISAGSPEDSEILGEEPYFTDVAVHEISEGELEPTLAVFGHGMTLTGAHPKAYTVTLTVTTGAVARIMFFDFGTFAGGMWCPDDGCIPESQFLVMKKESKDQLTASLDFPWREGA
jgi:hypothetical protein